MCGGPRNMSSWARVAVPCTHVGSWNLTQSPGETAGNSGREQVLGCHARVAHQEDISNCLSSFLKMLQKFKKIETHRTGSEIRLVGPCFQSPQLWWPSWGRDRSLDAYTHLHGLLASANRWVQLRGLFITTGFPVRWIFCLHSSEVCGRMLEGCRNNRDGSWAVCCFEKLMLAFRHG